MVKQLFNEDNEWTPVLVFFLVFVLVLASSFGAWFVLEHTLTDNIGKELPFQEPASLTGATPGLSELAEQVEATDVG